MLIFVCIFSRKSNLVPVSVKKFDGSKQLCRRDIDGNNSFIIVSFKWTKTIQVGSRVLRLPLAAISNSKCCPIQAYKCMCELNPFSAHSPAFAAFHRKPVVPITYKQVQLKLKSLIGQVGLNPKLFFSHSLRRGIFASQGLRFGSPFSPPLADLEHILRIRALIVHWLRLPVHVSNHKTFYTEHMLSTKCKQRWHRNALI